MNSKLIGRWGETKAAEYLKGKGYTIIAMGYYTRFGEIDIIARHKKVLAFIEVKTRINDDFALARDAVTVSKQRKMIITAGIWLESYGEIGIPRFDVIEVYYRLSDRNPEVCAINHIEDAFQSDT